MMGQPGLPHVAGRTNLWRLVESMGAVDVKLSAEDLNEIDTSVNGNKVLDDRYAKAPGNYPVTKFKERTRKTS